MKRARRFLGDDDQGWGGEGESGVQVGSSRE